MKYAFALLGIGIGLQMVLPAHAADATAPDNKTIVFVCLHGSVKSQMAAAPTPLMKFRRSVSMVIEVSFFCPPR